MGRMFHRVRQAFGNLSIRKKLLSCFLILLILSFVLTSWMSYHTISGLASKEMKNLGSFSVSQIAKNFDQYVDELYRLSNMALSDSTLRNAIRLISGSQQQKMSGISTIFQFLSNIYLYRSDMDSVALYTVDGNCYYQGFTNYSFQVDLNEIDWCREMLNQTNQYFLILGLRVMNDNSIFPKHYETFSVARRVVDQNGEVLGVLVLNTLPKSLIGIFTDATEDEATKICLCDEQESVICSSDGELTQGVRLWEALDSSNYLVLSEKLSGIDWTVSMLIPKASMMMNVYQTLLPLILFTLICLLGISIMYIILTYAFTRPIHRLALGMKKVESGDFTVSVSPTSRDELGELTVGFNEMTAHIDQLLKKMVEMEVREKESEYLLLQSQINPHFLYNTLEAIRMQCIVNREPEIARVVNTLSNLFRLSISHRERFVRLKEELEHVKNYMTIQNFRFGDKYELNLKVPQELLEYKTFKLMLQPLVENCVFHGLEMLPGNGYIEISAEKMEELLVITVRDNGVGIPEKELEDIRCFLENPASRPDNKSVGLRNVHERIRLFFPGDCGLKIDSREGQGTTITITMPAFLEEEELKAHE